MHREDGRKKDLRNMFISFDWNCIPLINQFNNLFLWKSYKTDVDLNLKQFSCCCCFFSFNFLVNILSKTAHAYFNLANNKKEKEPKRNVLECCKEYKKKTVCCCCARNSLRVFSRCSAECRALTTILNFRFVLSFVRFYLLLGRMHRKKIKCIQKHSMAEFGTEKK